MASPVTHNKDAEKRIMKLVPKEGLAGYRDTLRAIIQAILKALVLKLSIEGFDGTEVQDGLYFKPSAASTTDVVWSASPSGDDMVIGGGTIQGHIVDGITVSLPASGTRYVYAVVAETLTVSHGFVNSFAFSSAVLQLGSSVPDDDMEAGTYHIPLLKFVDGALDTRYESTSLGFRVVDDGTSTSKGRGEYYPA